MKKAMVFGAGVSGKGAINLLKEMGYEVILVDDKLGLTSQEGLKTLDGVELFIKSPGVPYNELVLEAKHKGIKVLDEIELSYQYMIQYNINTKIIAITGTNGKTTTTTKIGELLKYAGYKAEVAGNIGISFAQLLLEKKDLDYIALELSSFQLENLESFKPYISMIINLSPDHLSRYRDVEEYYDTKFNICKNQGYNEYFILNTESYEILKREDKILATEIKVGLKRENNDIWVENNRIFTQGKEILDCSKLALKGKHNLENTLFIVAVGKICGIDDRTIEEFLYNTKSLEHRMEDFFEYGNLKFINDSKGTNIDSTKFAIEAFNRPILICGGYDKKLDWTPLIELIEKNTEAVYLIGEIADILNEMLLKTEYKKENIHLLRDIKSCLLDIKNRYSKGEERVILFSPATSSYDQFKNFEQRGRVFKEMTKDIFGR